MNKNFKHKEKIFKKSSTTYYYSSILFTRETKDAVFTLYAFVRSADNLIDTQKPKTKEFNKFREDTKNAFKGVEVKNQIINDFAKLAKNKKFDPEWTYAFLDSMEQDLKVKKYKTYKQLQEYMYGSAEVIGLFMSKIFDTPKQSYEYARAQGEAMQLINFIRDIKEDHELGRQYMPDEDLQKFKTKIPPNKKEIKNFEKLIRFEIDRYRKIQKKADKGHKYINRRFRIMVKTSASMYSWTADQIYKNPMIVFNRKVKPSKYRVILTAIINAIS